MPVRGVAPFVVIKESIFPTIKMTAYDASVMMAIQGNLAVSEYWVTIFSQRFF